ncbi:MAG: hypothetical protein EOO01_32540, partial [Chitinophagaceae bacterium]
MVYHYLVTLRNDNRKYIDRLSLLLCSMSALLFLREQLITSQDTVKYLVGFLVVAFIVFRNIYLQRFRGRDYVSYNRALFFAAIMWTIMPFFQWLIFPLGFFAYLSISEQSEAVQKPVVLHFLKLQDTHLEVVLLDRALCFALRKQEYMDGLI